MKRYAINYNRVFPDHRVPVDYHFNKQLMQGPSTYFRFLKDSFNAAGVKHFHVYLSLFTTFMLGALGAYVFADQPADEPHINRPNAPGYRFFALQNRGGYGAYDNILQQFENEKGGIRDIPWE